MTEKNWYCASYDTVIKDNEEIFPDCDYFAADNDNAAINYAMELAEQGTEYADIGHIDLELLSVCKVDPNNEWEETETIWY